MLRSDSPAGLNRQRSVSTKRKVSQENSYAAAAAKNLEASMHSEDSSLTGINLAKVSSLCDKLTLGIGDAIGDPSILAILSDIVEAIKLTNTLQQENFNSRGNTHSHTRDIQQPSMSNMVSLGAVPKRPRTTTPRDSSAFNLVRQPIGAAGVSKAPGSAGDNMDSPELANFKETVREAEKATLVFNLDMGTVPLMNTATMCKKATLALTKMAANAEGKPDSTPSTEAIAAIDDLLSVSTGMEFFGRTTKTYKNSRDPASGAFCTVPVKYTFNDRETRMKAEQILRGRCKVNCSTPYPTILRNCIKQTAEHFKRKYPGDMIRVSVLTNKFALKVTRKPAGNDTIWSELDRTIPLPDAALNVTARSVPNDFVMLGLDIVPTSDIVMGPPAPPRLGSPAKIPPPAIGGSNCRQPELGYLLAFSVGGHPFVLTLTRICSANL